MQDDVERPAVAVLSKGSRRILGEIVVGWHRRILHVWGFHA